MSGIFGFETSPSFRTLKRNRNFYYLVVLGLAIALVASLLVSRSSTKASADAPVSVNTALAATDGVAGKAEIGDALVIDRASDGLNGNPLVLANGKTLFPLNDSGFLSFDEGTVFAAVGVKVQALGNETGFWAGTDTTQRVFVHVTPDDVSNKLSLGVMAPQALNVGDLVSVTGHFRMLRVDPKSFGLTGGASAQLVNQTEYVEADSLKRY